MPLMMKNVHGVYEDVSGVPVPKPPGTKPEEPLYEMQEQTHDDPVTGTGEVAQVPGIDCSTVPDGRYGRTKVENWFKNNGIPFDDALDKNTLIDQAKALCAEQETS